MAWGERYQEMTQGLPGLMQGLQQKQQEQEAGEGGLISGLLSIFGGAITMMIPGGQVAGLGMMVGGAGRAAGG